jgi:hypothetical protein
MISAFMYALLDTAQHINRRPRAWVRRQTKFFRGQYRYYRNDAS